MMEAEAVLHQQIPSGYRNLQPQASHRLQHTQPHLSHQNLGPQNGLDLSDLGDNDAVFQQDLQNLQNASHAQVFHTPSSFDGTHGHRHMHHQPSGSPHTPQHQSHHTFPILTPTHLQHNSIAKLQQDEDIFGSPDVSDQKSNGHLSTRVVAEPPNLAEWRKKLFDVDEMITLSQDQFETYFAHVDNVYSHRSTQRYKRKPFVSHYWDCRLKGRPPGTPKSEDPNKKKRKRIARERDLCDVKIKITEYFPGAMLRADFVPDGDQNVDGQANGEFYSPSHADGLPVQDPRRSYGGTNSGAEQVHPGSTGERFYTIQRVNGNGGNGKGDGVAGPHKHTLEESDRVKKNSVQRFLMKRDKEERKSMKSYVRKASGAALITTRNRSKEQDLKLFGTCSSPYVQRIWIALEAKNIPYQYIEVDPFKKPAALLEIDPLGPVPTLRHENWSCHDSTILLEYLDDLNLGVPLLPSDPRLRATARLWANHINRAVAPAFYALLQFNAADKMLEAVGTLQDEINKLVKAADIEGPFFLGATLGHVDVVFAPWMLRCSRVLKKFRGWPDPEPGSRWERWVGAVEGCEAVRATCCGDDVYEDAFVRWSQGKGTEGEDGGFGVP